MNATRSSSLRKMLFSQSQNQRTTAMQSHCLIFIIIFSCYFLVYLWLEKGKGLSLFRHAYFKQNVNLNPLLRPLTELRSCVEVEVAVPAGLHVPDSPYGRCGRKAILNSTESLACFTTEQMH